MKLLKRRGSDFTFKYMMLFFVGMFLCSSETLLQQENMANIAVPYIKFDGTYILYFLLVALFVILHFLRKRKVIIDEFMIFLAFKLLIVPFQILVVSQVGMSIRWGNIFFLITEIILYIWLSMALIGEVCKSLAKCFKILSVVISIEIIIQAIAVVSNGIPYNHISYKACMVIPFGGSNTLSTFILPILAGWLFESKNKKIIDWVGIILLTVGVILTKSRTAIIIFALCVLVYVFCEFRHKKTILRGVIAASSIFWIAVFVFNNYLEEIVQFLQGFSAVYQGSSSLDTLLSGRLSLIEELLQDLWMSPLVGFGPNYVQSRTHNLIYDTMYSSGIVGLIYLLCIIYRIIKVARRKERLRIDNFFVWIFSIYIVQAMFEISIFNVFLSDLLFFSSIIVLKSKYVIDKEVDC